MNEMNGIPRPEHARLRLWTIYDRPSDYPSNYVARLSVIRAGARPTEHLLVSTDLDALRWQMMALDQRADCKAADGADVPAECERYRSEMTDLPPPGCPAVRSGHFPLLITIFPC